MANSIDTTAIVGKYLSRQTTGTRLNADGNTADENTAILESIAIAMLLNPQAVLSIILNAKNSLQQLITADEQLIGFITAAIGETQNQDALPTSTADLVDAQTALVELDRIGRVDTSLQSFTRYQNSVSNFLNNQLAPLVKANPTGDFNRSGTEAKQDLFNSLSLFIQTHQLVIARLAPLAAAVSNYNSVDLSTVVHAQTIARVRTSLQQVQSGVTNGQMSNTVAALELMAGSASLQSISNAKGVYDDTIPTSQGLLIGPEPTSAFVESSVGPLLVTTAPHPHSTTIGADGNGPITIELPFTSRSGCPYVCNSLSQNAFTVPSGVKLFLEIEPGPSPASDGMTHYAISITSGSRTLAQVLTDINAGLAGGTQIATDFAHPDHAIIILGASSDSLVRVLGMGPGTFDPSTGVFTPDAPSAHAVLGFAPNQTSSAVDSFDLPFLQRFFRANYSSALGVVVAQTLTDQLTITSSSTVPSVSTVTTSGQVMSDFGFGSAISVPEALQIVDGAGVVQDPAGLGVLVGSVIHSSAFIEDVVSIDGERLLFSPALILPLVVNPVRVVAPVVAAVQSLMSITETFDGQFDNDILPLQGLLSPLLTTPSLAQVNDALRAFGVIEARLTDLLGQISEVVITESQEPSDSVAQDILQTLEERGLDRAQDLMSQCQFSDFFALTSENASKSTRLMKAAETSVSTDFQTSTVEEDQPDGNLLAGSNPTSIITTNEGP